MKKMCALVTGASSGIGEAIAQKLLDEGYIVYGMARDFSKSSLSEPGFHPLPCDLTHTKTYPQIPDLKLLVHAAGIGHFGPHESLSSAEIEEMIALNLTAPLLLTRHYLKALKESSGTLVFISSISAIQPAIMGAVYGATKAGIRHFAKSLFKEARKSGLRVITINPDITQTPFFDKLRFAPTDDPLSYIEPKDIADTLMEALKLRSGSVITDLTIEPQLFKLDKRS